MKFTKEQKEQILAKEKALEIEENKRFWLEKCPQISMFVKHAIYKAFLYVLNGNNTFNTLPMTEKDLNIVNTDYIGLVDDVNVLTQSIKGVLDRLVETSSQEERQEIANEFMYHIKKDGFLSSFLMALIMNRLSIAGYRDSVLTHLVLCGNIQRFTFSIVTNILIIQAFIACTNSGAYKLTSWEFKDNNTIDLTPEVHDHFNPDGAVSVLVIRLPMDTLDKIYYQEMLYTFKNNL